MSVMLRRRMCETEDFKRVRAARRRRSATAEDSEDSDALAKDREAHAGNGDLLQVPALRRLLLPLFGSATGPEGRGRGLQPGSGGGDGEGDTAPQHMYLKMIATSRRSSCAQIRAQLRACRGGSLVRGLRHDPQVNGGQKGISEMTFVFLFKTSRADSHVPMPHKYDVTLLVLPKRQQAASDPEVLARRGGVVTRAAE